MDPSVHMVQIPSFACMITDYGSILILQGIECGNALLIVCLFVFEVYNMVDGMMAATNPFSVGGHSHGHHPGHTHPSHVHHPSVQVCPLSPTIFQQTVAIISIFHSNRIHCQE